MAGIQVSGLLAKSSFDWKVIVDQLIAAESKPIERLETTKTANTEQTTALAAIKTAFTELQDSVQAMRADDIFSLRTVSSDLASTTWKTTSASGTPVGSYAFSVSRLATKAQQVGAANIGQALNTVNDVSGLTLANLNTATAITAGMFTVNGAQVNVATTDSLADVFAAVATATGGNVTGSYDAATDKISFTSGNSGEIILGSSVDSSNFLSAMKLSNNGGSTVASSDRLGTVKLFTATIANSGLATPVGGSGTFAINGVSIGYDASVDRMGDLLSRINRSAAGVTVAYDSTADRFTLTNSKTGDSGVGMSDPSGLLAALGLTTGGGASFVRGVNAQFSVNGGAMITSSTNTLGADIHGITGLSVNVDSLSAQTLRVQSDGSAMATYVSNFVTKFNEVQDKIAADTQVVVSGTKVSKAVLAGNREVEAWSRRLRSLAFDVIGGLGGSVKRLDDLGIDFNGTTSRLVIKSPDKLTAALAEKPNEVSDFFLKPTTGFVARMYSGLTNLMRDDTTQQNNLGKTNLNLDEQIARLKVKLEQQRETLTNAFIKMLEAQSLAESQNKTLLDAFSNKRDN
jgi:flagellar hook-associated protein 2